MSFSFVPYGLVGRLSAVVPAFVSLAPLVVSLAFVCTPGSASSAAGPYAYFSLAPDLRLCSDTRGELRIDRHGGRSRRCARHRCDAARDGGIGLHDRARW